MTSFLHVQVAGDPRRHQQERKREHASGANAGGDNVCGGGSVPFWEKKPIVSRVKQTARAAYDLFG